MYSINSAHDNTLRFIKFLFVGAINTCFGYGIFALLLFLGLHYAFASLVGTIMGVVFNFFTTGRLVFQNSNNFLIGKFISVYLIIYVINLAFLAIVDHYNLNLYIYGLLLILPLAFLAFYLNQRFVFKREIK